MQKSKERTFVKVNQYDENKCMNDIDSTRLFSSDPIRNSKRPNWPTIKPARPTRVSRRITAGSCESRGGTSSPRIQVTRENGRRGYTGCPRCLGENVFLTEASETINPMSQRKMNRAEVSNGDVLFPPPCPGQ